MKHRIFISLLTFLPMLLLGCETSVQTESGYEEPSSPQPVVAEWEFAGQHMKSVPLPKRMARGSSRFREVPVSESQLDFAYQWKPDENYKFEVYNSLPGGGICIGDYDGDDLPDVFMTQPNVGSRLYRNLGGLKFSDVTEASGVSDTSTSQGAAFVDVDNDRDLDLFVCHDEKPNQLWINQGDGTFVEEGESRGIDYVGNSVMMAFADYDRDGDLDGYLVTNRLDDNGRTIEQPKANADGSYDIPEETRQYFDVITSKDGKSRVVRAGQFDYLYRNDGNGNFTDVTSEVGMSGNYWGLSAVWWDYDNDGWIDLYVSNDFYSPDQLYHNNGDGTFSDVTKAALPHTPWYSMGADVADINNDGRLDFMGSDMSGTNHYKQKASMGDMGTTGWFLVHPTPRQYMRNALYLNTGTERFMEIAQLAGLSNTDWTWSLKFADFDEDGWIDLYVTNGMNRDWTNSDVRNVSNSMATDQEKMKVWLDSPQRRDANLAYRNTGDLRFEDVSQSWGLSAEKVSYGAALADMDRDGDLDVVVNNAEEAASLYENQTTDSNRVLIRLEGKESNCLGIGARIELSTAAGIQIRQVTASQGYMASNETLVAFGLGDVESIDKLTIQWPSGSVQAFSSLQANRYYVVTEAKNSLDAKPTKSDPMFRSTNRLAEARHEESYFDDYTRQPLLPNQLSQLGPGMAVGDLDGDGDEDIAIGGASGQSTRLMINENGEWSIRQPQAFSLDAECEDMGLVFVDVDADDDLDLYVVSGGVECEAEDGILQDRLYLNSGEGKFEKAPAESLPGVKDSGSCVSASDFDGDGDLDLFVGGRVVPGDYPVTPNSRLLRNNGGAFVDVTDDLAPGLRQHGMVTSSVWSDIDNDGDNDLVLTREWGHVSVFRNDDGKLVDASKPAGLTDRKGWYNSVVSHDIDADGDTDLIVGNFGWNTKYHASSEHPTMLYYGDFEQNGRRRLIEAEFEDETLFPVRGKSCSTNAMPFLGDKYTKFHDFAVASLQDIYTPTCLDTADRFEANSLESGVFRNDGKGRFEFLAFPTLTQIAPVFGISVDDVNGDGIADLVLAQNFYGPQPETGRFDGGVSLVMTGNGDGTFVPVSPSNSGVVVPGDAKSCVRCDLGGELGSMVVIATNDGPYHTLERSTPSDSRSVRLFGDIGNRNGIGARVRFGAKLDGKVYEVVAGDGYLSQSTASITVPSGATNASVQWPDGTTSEHALPAGERRIMLRKSTAKSSE